MKKQFFFILLLLTMACETFSQGIELTDIKDIVYARNQVDWQGNPVDSQMLDIYYPTGALSTKKYPMVLFLHGGSFLGGSRDNVSDACDQFADGGFLAIPIEYRVGYPHNEEQRCTDDTNMIKKAVYRAMQDANAAFRFLVANAAKYNIDTSNIFIGGASAGADLAYADSYVNDSVANIIYPGFRAELGGLQKAGNNYPANYTIKGICGMWGAVPGETELISANYRAIPTIMFKGGLDFGLPDGNGFFSGCSNYPPIISGTGIYDRLRALNVPAVYHLEPRAGHAAYADVFCVTQSICFFNGLVKKSPYSGYFTYYKSSCH